MLSNDISLFINIFSFLKYRQQKCNYITEMNSNTIPHPPNASWMPPIDPNDEVKYKKILGYFRTIRIKY
jgi:hypothetical protein